LKTCAELVSVLKNERKNKPHFNLIFAIFIFVIAIICLTIVGCQANRNHQNQALILGTTTSLKDTGLLDELLPAFEKKYRIVVKPIAVGTGEALRMGASGDADILLVHAPNLEKEFVRKGYGLSREVIMHNDFIIVGPPNDPAQIKKSKSAVEAFKKIGLSKEIFVSRGDNSGTHQKEQELWKEAGLKPEGRWYLETSRGMGEVLRITSEKQGYTLADRATYITLKSGLNLAILLEGDKMLINPYSFIMVNPDKFSQVNQAGAQKFRQFLLSEDARRIISNFGRAKYGQPLFFLE